MKLYIKNHQANTRGDLFGNDTPSIQIIEVQNERGLIPINPWDIAHQAVNDTDGVTFAEPLFDYQSEIGLPDTLIPTTDRGLFNSEAVTSPFDEDWAAPEIASIWHLEEVFSQLKAASDTVDFLPAVIRVAHFDTGYDPNHAARPLHIRTDLQRNFMGDEDPFDATDPNISSGLISNQGHGTGTSGILAGGIGRIPTNEMVQIGAALFIEYVPIRVANSVVLLSTDSFVEALRYVISLHDDPSTRIHVVSMSMGGLASQACADIINEAYEKGIFIVTAAGNNFGRATPRTLVYPARFNRVVAACGITFDKRPYSKRWGTEVKEMQGNYGPRTLMRTAMSAFTPNTPWATFQSPDAVSLQGAGTSSATPQIAAAAAIYWKKYHDELIMLEGWQQVEVIRQALFTTAQRDNLTGIEGDILDEDKITFYFGKGQLRALDALQHSPTELLPSIKKEQNDEVYLAFWRVLFGVRSLFTEERSLDNPIENMYQIELMQLIAHSEKLQALLDNEEKTLNDLSNDELTEFINIVDEMPEASKNLKSFLKEVR